MTMVYLSSVFLRRVNCAKLLISLLRCKNWNVNCILYDCIRKKGLIDSRMLEILNKIKAVRMTLIFLGFLILGDFLILS